MSPPSDTPQPPAALATPWMAGALVAMLTAVLAIVGGALGGMLVYKFSSTDDRFTAVDDDFAAVDEDFGAIDDGFAAIDEKFASFTAHMNDRFDSLEAGQAEIARTLAALVAVLKARAAVDAALAGRLLTPDATVPVESAAPSP